MNELEFNKLKQKNTTGHNSESTLYIYNKYLLKIFKQLYNIERKQYTLNALDENRILIKEDLKEILLPVFSFYVDGIYKGFGMKNIPGVSLDYYLKNPHTPFEQKLNALIKLGLFLEKLDNLRKENSFYQNFFINDLHAGNVIVMPDENIKIVDVDSFRIDNLKRFPSLYLESIHYSLLKIPKYQKYGDIVDANRESDIYCYIMIILEFITGKNFSGKNFDIFNYYMRELKENNFPIELIEAFKSIFDNEPNINPCHSLKKIKNQIIL